MLAMAMGWTMPAFWQSTPAELRLAFEGWQVVNGRKAPRALRLDRKRADSIRARAEALLANMHGGSSAS